MFVSQYVVLDMGENDYGSIVSQVRICPELQADISCTRPHPHVRMYVEGCD